MKDKTAEYWVIAILSLGALFFITLADKLPSASLSGGIGPRTFPLATFWLVLTLNALLIMKAVRDRIKEKRTGRKDEVGTGLIWKIIPKTPWITVGTIIMILLYALLLELLGFPLTTGLFILVSSLFLAPKEKRSFPRSLLLSTTFTVGIYLLFVHVFNIPLPEGFFIR